ncbi:unnamed protein product [Linum trigynum]|uniref:Uncharacterized protein n=1 Tax=Linum trigynum TaxID=586398 RepID=A0AAV2GBB4_9ROSI
MFYDYADIDELSLLDLPDIYEKCGGKIQKPTFYWKAPDDDSMMEIANDGDLMAMAATANQPPRIIELFAIGDKEVQEFMGSDLEEDGNGGLVNDAALFGHSAEEDVDYNISEDDSDYEGDSKMANSDGSHASPGLDISLRREEALCKAFVH